MGSYRRGKVALDCFRTLASKVLPQNQIFQRGSRIFQSKYLDLGFKVSNTNRFTSFSSIPPRLVTWGGGLNKHLHKPFNAGGRRFYYVDPYNVHHFRPRGPRKWFENPRHVFIVVVVGSGILITIYFGNLETVPYTNRTHWILLSKALERKLGEAEFETTKALFKGKVLPPTHPQSVRIRMMSKEITDVLQRGLRNEQVWSDVGYASAHVTRFEGHTERESLKSLTDASADSEEESGWRKEDEILYDSWVQQSRKKGHEEGPPTSHVEGWKWEVLVVDDPLDNAFCLPGGKIVVFTGLFEHFKSDAEIATLIGHEVGHAVARHGAEGMTKKLWFAILQLILYQFASRDTVKKMSSLILRLPFSRWMEMEADYIGLLLIASAGYDPRVAPAVYEKLGEVTGTSALDNYLASHPSGKKRAELLSQAKIMEEALTIYNKVKNC